MAKIRVYELARELNLTNKVLMDKLQGLGIKVGSHMSSLDDDTVQRIKAAIFGKKESDLEQTRVKPTVIRRRRKAAETPEAPVAETAPENLPAAEAAAPADEEPLPGPAVEAPIAADLERAAPAENRDEPAAEAPGPAATEAAAPAAAPEELLKKPAKKTKRDEPAKIIKLPVAPVERAAEIAKITPPGPERIARTPARPAPAGEAAAPPPAAEAKDAKRKKRKGKAEDTEAEKKFIKKKISFRTKAVISPSAWASRPGRSSKPSWGWGRWPRSTNPSTSKPRCWSPRSSTMKSSAPRLRRTTY